MKRRKKGFTLIELLTVLAIISMLIALLLPALAVVRNIAKETKQNAQLNTIGLALTAFRSDYGDYPPSIWARPPVGQGDYCGGQQLTEALFGWDLLGFHPDSAWRSNGEDKDGGDLTYDPLKNRDDDGDNVPDTLKERVGPYLELASANVFRLGGISAPGARDGLFDNAAPLENETFVLCDVFGYKRVTLADGRSVNAGTPILYHRADTSSKTIEPPTRPINRIYNVFDNLALIDLKRKEDKKEHPLMDNTNTYEFFYEYITDPRVIATPWPYRADSYILISAGADGEYGTSDDICNF